MTSFISVFGLNLVVLVMLYAEAYGPGGNSADKGIALFAPFLISAINLCLGLLCLVLMLLFRRTNPTASATADKFMQAFIIAFGAILVFAVPACFYGLSRL
jgi:hypothetical protein